MKKARADTVATSRVCVCVCVRLALCRAACVAHGVDDPAFPDGVRAQLLREFLRT